MFLTYEASSTHLRLSLLLSCRVCTITGAGRCLFLVRAPLPLLDNYPPSSGSDVLRACPLDPRRLLVLFLLLLVVGGLGGSQQVVCLGGPAGSSSFVAQATVYSCSSCMRARGCTLSMRRAPIRTGLSMQRAPIGTGLLPRRFLVPVLGRSSPLLASGRFLLLPRRRFRRGFLLGCFWGRLLRLELSQLLLPQLLDTVQLLAGDGVGWLYVQQGLQVSGRLAVLPQSLGEKRGNTALRFRRNYSGTTLKGHP